MAHGGYDALARVGDTLSTGRVILHQSGGPQELSLRVLTRGFDQLRTEISVGGLIKTFVSEGELGWVVQQGQKMTLTAEEVGNRLVELNPFAGLLGSFRQKRQQVSYNGLVIVDGMPFHHLNVLQLDRPPGSKGVDLTLDRRYEVSIDVTNSLISSISFFLLTGSAVNYDARETYVYSDYRNVENLAVPFHIDRFLNDQKVAEILLDRFGITSHPDIFQEP